MNKNDNNKTKDKIRVTDGLKDKIIQLITIGETKKNSVNASKAIGIVAMLILIISAVYFTRLAKSPIGNNMGDEFKIIGKIENAQVSYISVLYLDGYSYEGSGWMSYSFKNSLENVDEIKGEKLGEVTLDLRGKLYEGIPPDYSSTFEVGTEIYELKGMKKEYAIMLVDNEMNIILYRERKALGRQDRPIGLTVKDVFKMLSDYPIIKAVEFRDEYNGSLMRTSYENRLLDLLNSEIQDLNILNDYEIKSKKDKSSYRIPVNFIFEDGSLLHVQIYPETNLAYIFGGYINIANELVNRLEELFRLGNEYPRITDIISYEPEKLGYFQLDNNITGDSIISIEPKWSGRALYDMLSYYSVEKSSNLEGNLVATVSIGESEINFKGFKIYEGKDGNVFFEIDNEFYKILKGELTYKDILEYQQNYTTD